MPTGTILMWNSLQERSSFVADSCKLYCGSQVYSGGGYLIIKYKVKMLRLIMISNRNIQSGMNLKIKTCTQYFRVVLHNLAMPRTLYSIIHHVI